MAISKRLAPNNRVQPTVGRALRRGHRYSKYDISDNVVY